MKQAMSNLWNQHCQWLWMLAIIVITISVGCGDDSQQHYEDTQLIKQAVADTIGQVPSDDLITEVCRQFDLVDYDPEGYAFILAAGVGQTNFSAAQIAATIAAAINAAGGREYCIHRL